MSKNPYGESKFAHFASGRNLFLIVTACLVAVGTASAFGVTETKREAKAEEQIRKSQEEIKELKEEKIKAPKIPLEKEIPVKEEIKNEPSDKKPKQEKIKTVSTAKTVKVMPCRGEVLNAFSKGELVKDETMGDWRTHNGIDIAASEGSPVVSAMSGKVKTVRNDALWGNIMEIEHPGAVITRYCGLSDNLKAFEGDTVKAGEEIGTVASIPVESKTLSHLHFEVTEKGKYKDPLEFIK